MSRIKRTYSLDKIHLLLGGAGNNNFNIRIAPGQFKCIRRRMRHLVRKIMIKKKSNSQHNIKNVEVKVLRGYFSQSPTQVSGSGRQLREWACKHAPSEELGSAGAMY